MAGEEAPVSLGAAALEAAPAARVAFEDFIVPGGGLWTPPPTPSTHTHRSHSLWQYTQTHSGSAHDEAHEFMGGLCLP